MARRLNPSFKKFWGDELITEEKEDALLAAIYRHPKLPALPWRHTADRAWTLPTPYGTLKIWADIGKCRLVERHGALLIHCSTGKPVVFRTVAAAKVAAIYHLQNGFEHAPAIKDGCHWDVRHSALNDNLQKAFGISTAADACLLEDLHAQECRWTFRLPGWSNPEVGQHVLRTPYGALTVQRFSLDWTVHRNARQLVWFRGSMPVVFCNLRDAKLAALVHMHDYGCERFVDGTRWAEVWKAAPFSSALST